MFPDAEKKLGKDRLEALGAEMQERGGEVEDGDVREDDGEE